MCSDVAHTGTGLQKTKFVLKSPEAFPGVLFFWHFVQIAGGWRPAKYSTIEINRIFLQSEHVSMTYVYNRVGCKMMQNGSKIL